MERTVLNVRFFALGRDMGNPRVRKRLNRHENEVVNQMRHFRRNVYKEGEEFVPAFHRWYMGDSQQPALPIDSSNGSNHLGVRSHDNIGIIGDTHLPATHPEYLDFCIHTFEKYGCGRFIHIGDIFDLAFLSYHEKETDAPSAKEETLRAAEMLEPWKAAFPKLELLKGNHDKLPIRKGKTAGIPEFYIKSFREVFDFPPGWTQHKTLEIGNTLFIHGEPYGGKYGARRAAEQMGMNVVMGHTHTNGGVYYVEQHRNRIFGLQVTCGIDTVTLENEYARRYGEKYQGKVMLGCGVITDNGRVGHYIPMG